MRKYLIGVTAAAAGALAVPLLAQATMHQPRPPLTRAAAEQLVRDKFVKADVNRDGAVTLAEVDAAMAAHRAERFNALDANHDGQLSRGGFGQKWFARVDADKDGRVTLAEANTAALARFDKTDANHDGTISPEERHNARMQMREAWKSRND